MARELADRFQVRSTAHQRRQEVVTERVEAARRQRVPLLDLLERAAPPRFAKLRLDPLQPSIALTSSEPAIVASHALLAFGFQP